VTLDLDHVPRQASHAARLVSTVGREFAIDISTPWAD
jgi:hypothetical protein